MTRTRTIVFVGPTLHEVALPNAEIRPPVAVGDVLALARDRRVARIAIIDGYFEGMAAVWHKEILHAIEAGIEVWGAASMGALRAAELARYGMRGVGTIYRAFARGTLVADDEVAVAHLPAAQGYRAVSDALVNLRDGLATAQKRGLVAARTAEALVELARGRFYRERSWAQLVADGRAAHLPSAQLDRLAAWEKPDRKAADARLLVARLRRTRYAKPARIATPRTWAIRQLREQLRDR